MAERIGIILAGGLSRRMGGGDKALRVLAAKTMLDHVIERVRPQTDCLLLNANGDPARFHSFGLPVLPDAVPDYAGPLAGILTGMEWVGQNYPDATHLLSVPSDTPFLPLDLLDRLAAEIPKGADIALASSNGRIHPVAGYWPIKLAPDLRRAMMEEGMRKIDLFTARYSVHVVDFPTDPVDPFFNTNNPEELALAEQHLTRILR